jgi:putative oxidoreductase
MRSMSSAARPVTAGGCVSSRNSEDVSWKVFPLVFLSPRVRTLLGCDIALLIGRLMLGVVLFAHGWQKLVIKGIGGTYAWFQAMGIPLAIVATSFVTVVEFVGGALLLLGALTRVVVALHILVMIGAAAFVHISHGLFAQDGGWELVGVIAACELILAATGAGRFSIDHLVHRGRQARAMPPVAAPPSPARPLPDPGHESATFPGQATAPFGDQQRLRGAGGPVHQPADRDQPLFAKPISAPAPSPKPR